MRLHAGSHVDAPEHNVRGGAQIHELPLALFIGDAIVADLRDKMPVKAITEIDLEKAIGSHLRDGDRVCCEPITTILTTAARTNG